MKSYFNRNNLISVVKGVLTLNVYSLITNNYSVIYNALTRDSSLFTETNNRLIDEEIILCEAENPKDLLKVLQSKARDQIEKFFLILTGFTDSTARESRKNLRLNVAEKIIIKLKSRGFQGVNIHTIHGHFEEFAGFISFSLKEWSSEKLPGQDTYCNLQVTFKDTWNKPLNELVQEQSATQVSNSLSRSHSSAPEDFNQSCSSRVTYCEVSIEDVHGVGVTSPSSNPEAGTLLPKNSNCNTKKKMKCAIAIVLLLVTVGTGSAAVYLTSSPADEEPSLDTQAENDPRNETTPDPYVSNNFNSEPFDKHSTTSITQILSRKPKPKGTTTTSFPAFIQPETLSNPNPLDYATIFIPPQGSILSPSENDLSDTKFYSGELCSAAITFRTLNTTFMSKNSEKIKFADVPCASNVTGLEISGGISLRNLYNYLKKFPQIQYLSFNGSEICDSLDESFDLRDESVAADSKSKPPRILLESLSFLRLTNIPECQGLYRFLIEWTEFPNAVTTVVLDQSFISSQNYESVARLLGKAKLIKNLSFQPSNICPDCVVFSRKNESIDPWKFLEVLEFNIPHDVGFQGFLNLKGLLIPSLPNLKYFESIVEIPTKGNLKMFKRLVDLRFMNATFNFPSNQTCFSASIFSNFPKLQEAFVNLKFNDSSVCRRNSSTSSISLTNLEKNVGRSKLDLLEISSNCDIQPVKGWNIPCFDFGKTKDFDEQRQTVILKRVPNCSKAKQVGRSRI